MTPDELEAIREVGAWRWNATADAWVQPSGRARKPSSERERLTDAGTAPQPPTPARKPFDAFSGPLRALRRPVAGGPRPWRTEAVLLGAVPAPWVARQDEAIASRETAHGAVLEAVVARLAEIIGRLRA